MCCKIQKQYPHIYVIKICIRNLFIKHGNEKQNAQGFEVSFIKAHTDWNLNK